MILFFAPFGALERVALVEHFESGTPQKPMRVSTFAGGAGLRAAFVARQQGADVFAVSGAGGRMGVLLRENLERQNVPHVLVPIAGDTPGSFVVLDKEQGVVTDIPEAHREIAPAEADALLAALEQHLPQAELLVVSEHHGESDGDLWPRVFGLAAQHNVAVVADVQGAALDAAVAARVWLVRVALRTLQQRTEQSLQHDSAIIAEAQAMIQSGVENVCVTLGEEGALLARPDSVWRIAPQVVSHWNAIGCGDTLVGALSAQWLETRNLLDAVRYGCAAASVNVTHDEPGFATPGETRILLPRTQVSRIA